MSKDLNFLAGFLNGGIIVDNYIVQEEKETETTPVSMLEEPEEVFVSDILFKGNNQSKVAFCVYYENEEWINVKDRLFLEKILSAVGLSLDTVALININKVSYKSVSQIGERLPDSLIITLGLSQLLTRDFSINEISQKNGQQYLCVEWNLTDIAMSKEKKKVLWKNLKILLNL